MEVRIVLLQLQVIMAIIMVLLIRFAIRRLPKVYSYVLWILVFVRLLCPVSLETDFGIMPSQEESAEWIGQRLFGRNNSGKADSEQDGFAMYSEEEYDAARQAAYEKYLNALNEKLADSNTETEGAKESEELIVKADAAKEEAESGSISQLNSRSYDINSITTLDRYVTEQKWAEAFKVLAIIWILGAAVIIAYNGMALFKVRRILKTALLLKDNVYICSGINAPFTLGALRPKIYISEGMSEEEQAYIVCHENVHIRRKDYIIKNIAFILTALYWFNPFVWIAFYFLERDMEMSCDEKVIKVMGIDIKKSYSQSLLNFAQGKGRIAITPLTFGENNVKSRIKNVLSYKNAKRWSIVLGIVILAAAGVALFTTRSGVKEDAPGTEEGNMAGEAGNTTGAENNNKDAENAETAELTDSEHDTVDEALAVWADAFTDRNGQKLYELAADKEKFMAWDMVNEPQPGVITFGLSSPWPWGYGYNINQNDDGSATIRYYMETSAPEIYIADEEVRAVMQDGLYYIEHNGMEEYYSIDNKEQFQKLYGKDKYDFGYKNTGYSRDFYLFIMRHLINGTNPEYYEQYTDPVTAAVNLLHLGEGEGNADCDMIPIRVEGMDIPWLKTLSSAGEGSRAMVTYTFAEDGSTIEIVMELIEGSQGIWAPLTDDTNLREVYEIRELTAYESDRREPVYIQTSEYGIYRLDQTGLTCVYPTYVPDNMVWAAKDGRMYFPYSSFYNPGDLDYAEDTICILDIYTGETDMETYAFNDRMEKLLPLRWISVYGGFINLYGEGESYSTPLINTGTTALSSGNTWQGKGILQLNEQELNDYGIAMRKKILENPEVLMDISNRTSIENFAYIDMDGDGKTERISLSPTPDSSGVSMSYASFRLKVGDSSMDGWAEELNNNIFALSLDGKQILLALYEDGPSADPLTTLFAYENGKLKIAGDFGDDIRHCEIKNGIISGTERQDVLQTDWIKAEWGIDSEGNLKRISHESYDFTMLNDIILSKGLPVHAEPDENSESRFIEPQIVKFVKTDDTFSWILVEWESGESGWFKVDGLEIKELGLDYYEVFDDLNFAD